MKTMTCRMMGGPCDTVIPGATKDEIMKNGGDHVNEMAAKGDAGHIAAKKMMDDAVNDPVALKAWMDDFDAKYASLQ